ncbi:hypothetical protein AB0L75_25395 [Streptomyces sp. NPDC052101]|uniref:VMAP-C domain-containing protein n=1 Tax=Streptomyces sp. NPDC052101 TaxID=3155763 RepID=UPI00342D6493
MHREPLQLFRETLLCTLLGAFPDMHRREFRRDILTTMELHMDVEERDIAREHVRAIVQTVLGSPRSSESLWSLRDALHRHAPQDRALPWLELAVLCLTGSFPLPEVSMLRLIEVLREVPCDGLARDTLARYAAESGGSTLAADQPTLPEILLWLADRHGSADAGPFLRFATSLSDEPSVARTRKGQELRALLADLNAPAPDRTDDRLIIQIRLEAADPDHLPPTRYLLRSAYYRYRLPMGPLKQLNQLPHEESFSKDELIGKAPSRLSRWAELVREVHRADGRVRVEFLLPASLLSHEAEFWILGPSRTALGHNVPVVVRSLERYSDPYLDLKRWRHRWEKLISSHSDVDALEQIEWPSLELREPRHLADWLSDHTDVACLGLSVPYDDLEPAAREAVDDALRMEGVPAMVWRRDSGDPDEVVTALRTRPLEFLSELPEALVECRRAGRWNKEHVSQHITLLWDDPYCVDRAQDWPFEGMA